jgi:hypothetical protein
MSQNKNIGDQIKEEYFQWLKNTGRMKYELTDVFINNNGVINTEKKMAWVAHTTPDDWEEFCELNEKKEGQTK